MDQLSSIGVAFKEEVITQIFTETREYYESRAPKPFASKLLLQSYPSIRPYGLGEIYESQAWYWKLFGTRIRTPGFNTRANENTGEPTTIPLRKTNERIHASVRVRLEAEGLGPDDKGRYTCPALQPGKLWRCIKSGTDVYDPVTHGTSWDVNFDEDDGDDKSGRWVWVYCGPKNKAPVQKKLIEENIGPIERRLLELDGGIWERAVIE